MNYHSDNWYDEEKPNGNGHFPPERSPLATLTAGLVCGFIMGLGAGFLLAAIFVRP